LAQVRESQGKSLEGLLTNSPDCARRIAALHTLSLGQKTDAGGSISPECDLSELLATWVAHDLTHIHQLSRVMAYQYRDAVGPWSVYLGVLQCAGHSSP
jgi:hypothetical protein